MLRLISMFSRVGALAVVGGSMAAVLGTAQAQYGGYGYAPNRGGVSIQLGVGGYAANSYNTGYAGGANYGGANYGGVGYGAGGYGTGGYGGVGYNGGGYAPACGVGGGVGYPSPAARQGFREGELYYETGIAPNRPMSPAETRGFVAGERRIANSPWQVDPARQQGYREGELYWETGIAPNRPLSPSEAQGFRAGENRAATGFGGYRPY